MKVKFSQKELWLRTTESSVKYQSFLGYQIPKNNKNDYLSSQKMNIYTSL